MAAPCRAPEINVDRAGDAYMPPHDANGQPVSNLLRIRVPPPCATVPPASWCARQATVRVAEHLVPRARPLLYAPRLPTYRCPDDRSCRGIAVPVGFRYGGRPAHLATFRARYGDRKSVV